MGNDDPVRSQPGLTSQGLPAEESLARQLSEFARAFQAERGVTQTLEHIMQGATASIAGADFAGAYHPDDPPWDRQHPGRVGSGGGGHRPGPVPGRAGSVPELGVGTRRPSGPTICARSSADVAFALLAKASQQTNRKLLDVATAVATTGLEPGDAHHTAVAKGLANRVGVRTRGQR